MNGLVTAMYCHVRLQSEHQHIGQDRINPGRHWGRSDNGEGPDPFGCAGIDRGMYVVGFATNISGNRCIKFKSMHNGLTVIQSGLRVCRKHFCLAWRCCGSISYRRLRTYRRIPLRVSPEASCLTLEKIIYQGLVLWRKGDRRFDGLC